MIDPKYFPEDIYLKLVALPYRVGLYVSTSDMTGGHESQKRELLALENMVTFFVEDTLKSEFAQSVMLLTLQNKIHWSEWQSNIDDVPQECSDIIEYLRDRLDARNLNAFKSNLLEIGISVAMAYRETEAEKGFLQKMRECLTFHSAKTANNNSQFLNISDSEKNAINKLADTFGLQYKVA